MSEVAWMDFSGAPPVLIPKCCLPQWQGLFLPADPNKPVSVLADLELPDGRKFDVCDDFDFDNPKTDYDRICAHTIHDKEGHGLYSVPPAELLFVNDYSDGTVGWCDTPTMILTVSQHVPDLSRISEGDWANPIQWRIPDSTLLLMNSCEHGAQPRKGHYVEVELDLGTYRIDSFDYTIDSCVMIYRFTRIE